MRRFVNFTCIVTLLIACGACSTLSVDTDYNLSYDFTKLKTYTWLDDGKAPGNDIRINNDLVIDRVRAAVERNLAAKGYVKSDGASADFMVSWLGAIKRKLQYDTIDHFYSPYGYGALGRDPFRSGMGVMRTSTAREYEVGTLIIDILDHEHHKLIWRGSGTDRLDGSDDPKVVTRNINTAVDAILSGFPPVSQ